MAIPGGIRGNLHPAAPVIFFEGTVALLAVRMDIFRVQADGGYYAGWGANKPLAILFPL